ncbi:GNAT family N-acetyltransferase [Glaciimonas sp. PCH181]|uniref:GNAT family N-acetyltransferase n=1 Tax=Glaciimonas sp. PCH181 TaxID=2133943 RepID=UPI000D3864C0|nr:GNAT family N-acetyltransferase [Glaciimonas sp. PCH181]PUA18707.1 GNAT family N-acetyltransferase [Glaciimonas sp. PCH181]
MMHWYWQPFHRLSLEQLYDALNLRQRVFVIEQNCLYLDADGLDQSCWHGLGYDDNGTLQAYARIVPPKLRYPEPSIGRVIVSEQSRGKGVGQTLMQQAIAQTSDLYPGLPIRISAQAQLEVFYGTLGFATVGELYDDTGIPHIDMLYQPPK